MFVMFTNIYAFKWGLPKVLIWMLEMYFFNNL